VDPVAELERRLKAKARPQVKTWFENYLRGAISYRGVKSPVVAQVVAGWRTDLGLGKWTLARQLDLCLKLLLRPYAEDKFAGTIYLQKYLLKDLDPIDFLEKIDGLFKRNFLHDWSTADWFSVRVLEPLIEIHNGPVMKIVTAWRKKPNLWQRRASAVALRRASRDIENIGVVQRVIADLLPSDERFIQTGVGWLIADLSKRHPREAAEIVERHLDELSTEVIRRHTKRLRKHKVYLRAKSKRG